MTNLKCNFELFVTQCRRSRDPNLGHDPLFADTCSKGLGVPSVARSNPPWQTTTKPLYTHLVLKVYKKKNLRCSFNFPLSSCVNFQYFFGLHIKSFINLKILVAVFGIGGYCPQLRWAIDYTQKMYAIDILQDFFVLYHGNADRICSSRAKTWF